MPSDEAKTIKVRCSTWDQVEAFYSQKMKGNSLVVKMPAQPANGETVTVAIVLPNGLVFSIDGTVTKSAPADAQGRYPVAMTMALTPEMRARLDRLVADGRGDRTQHESPIQPPTAPSASKPSQSARDAAGELVERAPEPSVEDVVPEEKGVYRELDRLHKRQRELAANEVLGVPWDASWKVVRSAYFALAKKHHPDMYGKYVSHTLRVLASEVFIHINKAYDRLRDATTPAGARMPGPARRMTSGWIAEPLSVDDCESHEPDALPAKPASEVRAAEPAESLQDADKANMARVMSQPPKGGSAGGIYQEPGGMPRGGTAQEPGGMPRGGTAQEPGGMPKSNQEAIHTASSTNVPADEPKGKAPFMPTLLGMPAPSKPKAISQAPSLEEPRPQPASAPRASTPLTAQPASAPRASTPLTAEDLFGDMPTHANEAVGSSAPAESEQPSKLVLQGKTLLAEGRCDEARISLAGGLHADPRNRALRALYHVATGMVLRAHGKSAEASLQFEAALAHDRDCVEARQALEQDEDKKGILRRLFDK